MKAKYERFEDFKADIWKWKGENREKYNRFAQMMSGCDEQGLLLFYRTVAKHTGAGMLDVQTCGYVSKLVIQTSIKGHYRTCEDWERFFAGQNAARSGQLGEWALKEVCEGYKYWHWN